MTIKKQQFKAHLIKYREAQMKEPIWFWVNPSSGATLSPKFSTQEEAELWFDTIIEMHNQTSELLDRAKNGKFYTLKGKVDVGDLISSTKVNDCPFDLDLKDDILEAKVLATTLAHARKRVCEYFEILEWIE